MPTHASDTAIKAYKYKFPTEETQTFHSFGILYGWRSISFTCKQNMEGKIEVVTQLFTIQKREIEIPAIYNNIAASFGS